MKKFVLAALATVSLSLAACGGAPEVDPCLSAPDVKQCEATRAASASGNNDALLYGVGGYLLGSMMGGGSSRSTHTTVEKHYYSPRPSYRPSYRAPSYGSYSSRSTFRSSFGRRRF
ncbi:hypothetical protein [Sphingobium sp. CCH11-B1]|uniref:hypothetical protein n=1 Tax=Sphingobium sp. CCH11-B1 TaxID=1768781 RepID=UPI00082F351D|nr:hypothetical protein [Sphingobium sp. CCH11-B1]